MSILPLECNICGCEIINKEKHQQFHNYLLELAQVLEGIIGELE
jgi:hypothetical protein